MSGLDDPDDEPRHVLLCGLGVTNLALGAALASRSVDVVAVDDRVGVSDPEARRARESGITMRRAEDLDGLVRWADVVIPAPGLPERHRVFEVATMLDRPVESEFDVVRRWDERPLLSITGTNGKTTVTELVSAMMNASGVKAVAAGNTDVPLVAAVADPTVECFVVEASSFRLARTRRFVPRAAVWLNFAPDHLDVHRSIEGYEAAKARQWRDLSAGSVGIANEDDPVVAANFDRWRMSTSAEAVGFTTAAGTEVGIDRPGVRRWYVRDGSIIGPDGTAVIELETMARRLPHDVSNALAAAATACAGGATADGVAAALSGFRIPPHRVQYVATVDGIAYYDDSKATAPHAVRAAVSGFESVVLIAGGRNKGLDLSVMARLAPPVRAVVAIGEAAAEIEAAFAPQADIRLRRAATMQDAVDAAAGLARPGDVVVLSPGCASFDWYPNYAARGEDFAAAVRERATLPR
ncbi:MAG: UDP-N-acetylmuramoyl-L-alanine--D-glutamate ligase [Microthrixaceae bacterium]